MGGRSSSVGNRTRRTPVGGKGSTRRRVRPATKSVRKTTPRSSSRGPSPEEIQEIIKRARGAKKIPTTRRKPVARKKPVPPKITRTKPPTLRKPAVQPIRKKPTPKPVASKKPTAPKIPESVQKRIEEMMASGRMKAPTTPRKTTPRKTVAKKAAPKKTVAKKKPVEPKLPEGVRSGGKTYTNPVSGDKMYQPPMPTVGRGQVQAMVMPTPINLTTGKPERLMISEPTAPRALTTQQQTGGGSFESAYVDWLQSKPSGPPRRPKGMGAASKSYQAKRKKYESDLAKWEGSEPSRATYTPPVTTAPTAPTAPVVQPDYVPPPLGEAPDKFAGRYVPPTSILGTPDMSISSNIVGQSFDPSFAASFTPPPQPPGSTFGGYGQQAPMQALAPYAGMAQNNPQPTDFFPTYIPKPAPIIETVQRPEPNRPTPRPDARPVMGAPRPVFVGPRPPSAGIGAPLGRDQITEFLSYR